MSEIVLKIEEGLFFLGKMSRGDRKKREQRHKCKHCHWRDVLFSDRKKEENTVNEDKIMI